MNMADTTPLGFEASVSDWVKQTQARMTAVFKESAQRVFADMRVPVGAGGNMPVVTGFLRASFLATLNTPADTVTYRTGSGPAAVHADTVALVIAGAKLGDTIYGVFTANYARHVEYGTSRMTGRGFVRLAAQKWPQIVAAVSQEAESRASTR
jgi:hypothetical protein